MPRLDPRRAALLIVALTVAAYAGALGGGFHFDDGHAIVDNPAIRSLASAGRFFVDPTTFSVLPQNQNYRPVLLLTYALTAQLFGVRAAAFLAGNLAVHAATAVLVFLVVARLRQLVTGDADALRGPLLAGAIFAVHPLFSECVSFVSARSESLSALLALSSLLAYLAARRHVAEPRRAALWLALSSLAIAAALLAKLVVASFPMVLLAVELAARERQPWRPVALRLVVVSVAVAAVAWLGVRLTPDVAVASAVAHEPLVYLRSELPAYFHYLRLFVWPAGQSADPDFPVAASWLEPRVVASGLALLALAAFSAWGLLARRARGAALAVAWFLLFLAPSSSVAPLPEIVNEHRPYLAAVALCALAAEALLAGLPLLLRPRAAPTAMVVALVLLLGGLTTLRGRAWRDEQTLWRDVVDKAPSSTRAQMNYGLALMQSGQMALAEPHLREAVRLAPRYAYARINLGSWLLASGQAAEAVSQLDAAVALAPDLFYAHLYRGLAAEKQGEPPAERARHFGRVVALSPGYADGQYHLSLALDALGDVRAALVPARRAVALRGSYDDRFLLAYELLRVEEAREALPILDALATERPTDRRVTLNQQVARRLVQPR